MNVEIDEPRVGTLMTANPIVIDPDAPIEEAEATLKTHRVTGLPVVAGGELVGVVSQTDLVVAHSSAMIGANWQRLRVRHVMSAPAVTVHAGATVRLAAREMVQRHIHRLVVIDDGGRPVGVVTPLDLLRSLVATPGPDAA